MSKQWYVLRVASNKEMSVREALVRKVKVEGLEETVGRIIVPTERRPKPQRKPGDKKYVERKMYPGYVFIEMELGELAGVQSVKAEQETRQVTVSWQEPASWEQIKGLLHEINYPPADLIQIA